MCGIERFLSPISHSLPYYEAISGHVVVFRKRFKQYYQDAYLTAYKLLETLQKAVFDPNFLPEALKLAQTQKGEETQTHQLYQELQYLIGTSDQILEQTMNNQQRDRRRLTILAQLNQIDQSIVSQQNKLINWLRENRKELKSNIQSDVESRQQKILQMLIEQGQELPANVLANLIAALLANLSQPYLSSILPELLKLLR